MQNAECRMQILSNRIRTVAAVERRPQRVCCNRRLSWLCGDVWKFIFKHNRSTSTSICIADNKRAQTSRPKRHRLTNSSLSEKTKPAMKNSSLVCWSGKGGIRTPGTVTRTPHFECGPIDHSGTFPCAFCGANVRIYFLIPTILHNILHFFCVTSTIEDVFTNIFPIFVCTKRSILSFSI